MIENLINHSGSVRSSIVIHQNKAVNNGSSIGYHHRPKNLLDIPDSIKVTLNNQKVSLASLTNAPLHHHTSTTISSHRLHTAISMLLSCTSPNPCPTICCMKACPCLIRKEDLRLSPSLPCPVMMLPGPIKAYCVVVSLQLRLPQHTTGTKSTGVEVSTNCLITDVMTTRPLIDIHLIPDVIVIS